MTGEDIRPPAGPLRVLVHGSLALAEPAWRALQAAGSCYGFQTFEWLSAWQELLGEPAGVRPAVVEVRSGPPDASDAPVMIVPLGIYPKAGLKILSFLGGRVTDYHAPLLDPAFARSLTPESFAALWKDILRALPRADYIHFWRMPESVEGLPNPFIGLPGAVADDVSQFAVLPDTFEEYIQGRTQKFRRTVRNKRNIAEKLGPVVFSVPGTPAETTAAMDALVRQKSRRHLETTGHNPYAANPRLRQFYERLIRPKGASPRGMVAQLTINGEPVATEWGFIHGGRFLDILTGYEAEHWARYSPGRIMKEEIIRWSIESGLGVFDLTVGGEGYKAAWAESSMPAFSYRSPITLLGQGFALAVASRQALKQILAPLREALRRRRKPKETEA